MVSTISYYLKVCYGFTMISTFCFLTWLKSSHKENNQLGVNKYCHTPQNKFMIWIALRLISKDHMYFFSSVLFWHVFLEGQGSVVGLGAD